MMTGTSAGDSTWYSWSTDAELGTITSSGSSATWRTWVDSGLSTASSGSNTVWISWCGSDTSDQWTGLYQPHKLTVEQQEQRRLQREEAERQRKEHARKKAEANEKALALLCGMLTQEQREQLNTMSAFEVETERAKYRIKRGRFGNVEELDADGRIIARYCIHPRQSVPDADTMLAQKLMLETDEAAFLRMANKTQIRVQ